MYHVITRTSDGAVMDCRPWTVGIEDVLNNQVLVNHGGEAKDYEITTSETPVERADLRTPTELAARAASERKEIERKIVDLRVQIKESAGLTIATDLQAELTAQEAKLAELEK